VARLAIANPLQVHLIAKAKTKTDKIDARVLAQFYAAGFLPEVWVPDEATLSRRRQVTRRNQLTKQRVRLTSITQSIQHECLDSRMLTCSASKGARGSGRNGCPRTNAKRSSGTSTNTTA
jgi:transposase